MRDGVLRVGVCRTIPCVTTREGWGWCGGGILEDELVQNGCDAQVAAELLKLLEALQVLHLSLRVDGNAGGLDLLHLVRKVEGGLRLAEGGVGRRHVGAQKHLAVGVREHRLQSQRQRAVTVRHVLRPLVESLHNRSKHAVLLCRCRWVCLRRRTYVSDMLIAIASSFILPSTRDRPIRSLPARSTSTIRDCRVAGAVVVKGGEGVGIPSARGFRWPCLHPPSGIPPRLTSGTYRCSAPFV